MILSTARAGAAQAMLDRLIPQSARAAGVDSWPAYLAYNDARATRHLRRNGLMHKRQRRHPIPDFDEQGDLILRVPLDDRGDRFAIVYPTDWIEMQEAGCDGLWCCDNNGTGGLRVKVRRPMAQDKALNHVIVARHILDLGAEARMCYRNGDPLDLRRGNLHRTRESATPDTKPARYRARTAVRVGAERREMAAAPC